MDNTNSSGNFYEQHEYLQNKELLKLLSWFLVSFVVILILKVTDLLPALTYLSICILFFSFLLLWGLSLVIFEIKPYSKLIKYLIIYSVEIVIIIAASNKAFQLYLVYLIAPILSLLYLNKNFSLSVSITCYICTILNIFYRGKYAINGGGYAVDPNLWILNTSISLTIGFLINGIIIIVIAKRNHNSIDIDYKELKKYLNIQNTISLSYVAMLCQKHEGVEEHINRTTEYVKVILYYLQKKKNYSVVLNDDYVYKIISSSMLHDIGIISVPDYILAKSEPLNADELSMFRNHTKLGEKLLKENIRGVDPEFFNIACESTLYHHENYDGSGYPFKISGKAIPLSARVIAAANSIDVIFYSPSGRNDTQFEEGMEKFEKQSGVQLDPDIVEVVVKNKEKIKELIK